MEIKWPSIKGVGNTWLNKDLLDTYRGDEIYGAGWNACLESCKKAVEEAISISHYSGTELANIDPISNPKPFQMPEVDRGHIKVFCHCGDEMKPKEYDADMAALEFYCLGCDMSVFVDAKLPCKDKPSLNEDALYDWFIKKGHAIYHKGWRVFSNAICQEFSAKDKPGLVANETEVLKVILKNPNSVYIPAGEAVKMAKSICQTFGTPEVSVESMAETLWKRYQEETDDPLMWLDVKESNPMVYRKYISMGEAIVDRLKGKG